jgi:hypothetical protein
LADHWPFGDNRTFSDRLPNSLIGPGFVGRTGVNGGTDVYVGKGVGVDFTCRVGLGVQVGGKEREEAKGVSVSIRSNETLNVLFPHADTSVSSSNEMIFIFAPIVIFVLRPDL